MDDKQTRGLRGSLVALAALTITGTAFAQGAPPVGGAPVATSEGRGGDVEKKIGVGGDLLVLFPIGDLGDETGPQIGPVVRGGYRVIPPLELTLRIGYLAGLKKDRTVSVQSFAVTVSAGLNLIPIWAGARYFFMDPSAGIYGAAELGLNVLVPTVSDGGNAGDSLTRFGFNAGVGYVISKDLPIDIRAQFTMYNLLLKEIPELEPTYFGIGLSAGYTFQF